MKVGSLVECVKDNWSDWEKGFYPDVSYPVVGNIYTVRQILVFGYGPSIRLEELLNPVRRYKDDDGYSSIMTEKSFAAKNFREVQPPMELSWIEELQLENA